MQHCRAMIEAEMLAMKVAMDNFFNESEESWKRILRHTNKLSVGIEELRSLVSK